MRGKHLYFLMILLCIVSAGMFWNILSANDRECIYAASAVSNYEELKKELEASGNATVSLMASFAITDTIYVKGTKSLQGNGHTLSRFHKGKEVFGDTLFTVSDAELSLQDVILSGEGSAASVRKKTEGRLLDLQNGKVTLEEGVTLTQNCNKNQNHDGGGAVRILDGGFLIMNDGKISENQNVYGGAGVHIDNGGNFIMRGGTLSDNQSYGIGGVEGFDGRGGAIYNQGKTTISGGKICRNQVKGFTSASIKYGGVGGMLYNQGECQIQGGIITENRASYGGGAIYNDRGSELRITGGTVRGNDARVGEGLFLAAGNCRLGGNITLSSIYLTRGVHVQTEDTLVSSGQNIIIIPEQYKEGQCVVTPYGKKAVSETVFTLQEKGNFVLVSKNRRLYITKKNPEKKNDGKEVSKKQEQKKKPQIRVPEDLTSKSAKKSVQRSKTKKAQEQSIIIQSAPRYFFVWETGSFTEENWRRELLEKCRIQYGDQKKEKVLFQWRWGNLLKNRAGCHLVEVSADGENWIVIPVTLVQESTDDEETGYVRFYSPDTDDTTIVESSKNEPEEIWQFSQQDIKEAKKYMREREDPFSSETNQEFLIRFERCKMGEEE